MSHKTYTTHKIELQAIDFIELFVRTTIEWE